MDLPSVNEATFREITKSAKKKENQLKKHLVDESLNDVERSIFLLKNGTIIQKTCVLMQLPTLLKINGKQATDSILNLFLDTLWKESPDIQILIGKYIPDIFPLLSDEQMASLFPMIKNMISLKNKTVSAEWRIVLVMSIQYMPIDLVKGEILQYCLSKGSYTESVQNRVMCCQLFGAIATRFDGPTIVNTFLDKAITMCQDTEYTVRKCMAEQLLIICQAIGLAKAKETVAKELFELLEDETKEVKNAAFQTLVNLLDFFDHNYRKKQLLPYFLQWINSPPKDIYQIFVTHFGEFLWKLVKEEDINNEETISAIATFFRDAANNSDPVLRQRSAYNFPAVLKTLGAKRYPVHLHNAYKSLCEDQDPQTRKKIAAGFHEVCMIIGKEKSVVFLKDLFIKLLQDTNEEVQKNLGEHMDIILAHFNVKKSAQIYKQILPYLIQYESNIKKNWRRLETFYGHFIHFPNYFTPQQLKDTCITMLRKQLKIGVIPVKKQTAKAIVFLIRNLASNSQQVEIFKSLIDEFAKSKSYWDRLTFLMLVPHVIDKFSRRFFKQIFFEHVIALAKDPVPNVRMKFCTILPLLKRVLKPPGDVELLALVKEHTSYLTLDSDVDVMEAAKEAQNQLRKIETEMNREHQLNKISPDDRNDKLKEEEENAWIEAEKEAEKSKKKKDKDSEIPPQPKNGTKNGTTKPPKKPAGKFERKPQNSKQSNNLLKKKQSVEKFEKRGRGRSNSNSKKTPTTSGITKK